MSESAGKTFRGLQEAYASMYSNNSDNLTEETIVSEVQEEQEFEINEEVLYESLKKYLISEGFVKTEKQAENAIPHMSEEWVKDIVESILTISEDFDYYINSLIEEGYDLSSYTEEDLFETYINETHNVLSEQLAGDMPGLGWLRGLTGIFGAGAASRAVQTKPRPYRTRPEGSAVDYGQMTLEKPKPKPAATTVKTDSSATGDSPILDRTGKPIRQVPVTQSASQPAASTGGPSPEPPKKDDKKPEEPKTEKPKSNFKGELRPKARARMDQKLRQQSRSQATERIFKALERFNQSPVKKGADLATTMGRLRTGAAALKNVLIGKTGAGAITRGISLAAPGVADEIRTGGVIRTGVTQGLQTSLQKSRTEGEKEKERIKRREEQKRDDYARSQQQTGSGWSSVPSNR